MGEKHIEVQIYYWIYGVRGQCADGEVQSSAGMMVGMARDVGGIGWLLTVVDVHEPLQLEASVKNYRALLASNCKGFSSAGRS